MIAEAKVFLEEYLNDVASLEIAANLASWKAANSGKKEDFDAAAQAQLALRRFHSDPAKYQRVRRLAREAGPHLPPAEARSLQLAELAFRRNQLPAEMLQAMVELATEIERLFNTFRAELDGTLRTNNDLLDMLRQENDSGRRRKIWESLKQVGGRVAPQLIQLAKIRNRAARTLGFGNFWEMSIELQEHQPASLLRVFAELDRLTREPFIAMKAELDRDLGRRFGVDPAGLMPWHYDNPFFQDAPPTQAVDLDEFYGGKTKEEIVEIARRFYADIGLPIDDVLERSDLYEREGKDQHAFCVNIDRAGDVRTLCNVKPTAAWMDTMLHEEGHAVYDLHVDRRLPFNVREPAHAFTTEGVAMLFGSLAKTPGWLVDYAGADDSRVQQLAPAILEQRRREQLIFARWTMVMLHFEKALYEDPDRKLNVLWWDLVERFQALHRPPGRNEPDWAAKPHFTIAPVYYHNYMLGEMFAAQLRRALAAVTGHTGPSSALRFRGRKEIGQYLRTKVFAPGSIAPWPAFVQQATGEPLTARHFAAEVGKGR